MTYDSSFLEQVVPANSHVTAMPQRYAWGSWSLSKRAPLCGVLRASVVEIGQIDKLAWSWVMAARGISGGADSS